MSELLNLLHKDIPSGWRVTKIDNLKSKEKYALSMGPFGSNIKAENFKSSGVPIIKGINLNAARYVDGDFSFLTEEKANELRSSNCFPYDLIFTHRGTIGQVSIVPRGKYTRYVVSQSGMKLKVDPDLVNPLFLLYFFKSRFGQYQLLLNEAQVGVPSISSPLQSLKDVEVLLPPLTEQEAIAEVLSSLDDKIDLLHRNNKTLEQLAETLFRQWFVVEVDPSWQTKKLGDVVSVIDNRGKTPDFTDVITPFPIIEVNALTGSSRSIDFTKIKKYVNKITYENWFRSGHPQHGDILISTVGSIGEIAMYLTDKGTIAQNIVALRSKGHSAYYLYQYLLFIQKEIKEYDIGSVQPSLKVTHLTQMEIVIPNKEKEEVFDEQATALTLKIQKNNSEEENLKNLRDLLLPKLMSGAVTLNQL